MSQNYIQLTTRALKISLASSPTPTTTPITIPPPVTPLAVATPHIPATTTTTSSSTPTHVGTLPLKDFKKSFRQDVGNYKLFLDHSFEKTKYVSFPPNG